MVFKPIINKYILIIVFVALLALLLFHIFRRNKEIVTNILSAVRIFIILLLSFIILMRPTKEVKEANLYLNNLDVMFVVDDTMSMWAEDMGSGTRMEEVRKDVDYLIDSFPGANFALIKFDNYSEVLSPYTQDASDVKDSLEAISMISDLDAKGTSLNTPYKDMESLLKSTAKKQDRKAIVFFISDGEITGDEQLSSYAGLKDYITDGAVLGYGTEEGGEMHTDYGYVYDYETSQHAVSKIDETNLNQIASDLGLSYIHVQEKTDLDERISIIKAMAQNVKEKKSVTFFDDYYFYFAVPLLIFLGWELFIAISKKRL